MLKRLSLAIVAAVLGGCVLESDKPLIPEEQGELLLGTEPAKMALYDKRDGGWQKDKRGLTFVPEGRHYNANDGKSDLQFLFQATANGRWAMQVSDTGDTSTYLIAEQAGGEIFLQPLDCKSLKASGTFEGLVEFKDDDCKTLPGVDAGRLFAVAAQMPFDPPLKMVRE